jgi:hypothetical protein
MIDRVVGSITTNQKGNVCNIGMTNISTHVANYLHTQMIPSTKWTINHNLGRYPSVTTIDSSGNEVCGNVKHLSLYVVQIEFAYPFGGKASCN